MKISIYRKGHCLECDIAIPNNQIFCLMHRETSPVGRTTFETNREIKVSDMQEGDSGYTEEGAFFEIDSKLYVLGSAVTFPMPDMYKRVHITLNCGIFQIDRRTIDIDEILFGWPDMDESPDCFEAKLV